jgi:hypothetical protein
VDIDMNTPDVRSILYKNSFALCKKDAAFETNEDVCAEKNHAVDVFDLVEFNMSNMINNSNNNDNEPNSINSLTISISTPEIRSLFFKNSFSNTWMRTTSIQSSIINPAGSNENAIEMSDLVINAQPVYSENSDQPQHHIISQLQPVCFYNEEPQQQSLAATSTLIGTANSLINNSDDSDSNQTVPPKIRSYSSNMPRQSDRKKSQTNTRRLTRSKVKLIKEQLSSDESPCAPATRRFGNRLVKVDSPDYFKLLEVSREAVKRCRENMKVKQEQRDAEIVQIEQENKRLKAQVEELVAALKKVLVQMNPVKSLPEEVEGLLMSIKC